MENTCIWSGEACVNLIKISATSEPGVGEFLVCPKHQQQLQKYLNYTSKWKTTFLVSVFALSALMVLLALLAPPWTAGLALIALSVLLILLPFPTPQTIQFFGVERSIRIVRALALLMLGVGLWLAFFRLR